MPESESTPSPVSAAPVADGAAGAESSASDQEQEGPSLLARVSERLFGRRDEQGKPVSGESTSETGQQPKPSAQRREYSDEEFTRAVQSETDRREAKRTAEQREADKKRLREEDPYAYVDQEKLEEQQREAEGRFTDFLTNIGQQYDAAVLDPVMQRLSDDDRKRILTDESLGVGLDGRKGTMAAALDVLLREERKRGEADAADKLRKNPAFRKQVLGEFRRSDDHVEPDLVPANGAVAGGGRGMNDFIRVSLGKSKYRGPSPD